MMSLYSVLAYHINASNAACAQNILHGDRRENEERAVECEEMRERLAMGSVELADVRRRAEAAAKAASGELSRAEVRLRSAEAQKASLAAEVAIPPLQN